MKNSPNKNWTHGWIAESEGTRVQSQTALAIFRSRAKNGEELTRVDQKINTDPAVPGMLDH